MTRKLKLNIQAKEELNCGGNACVVYIYKLKDNTNFIQAPMEAFWQNDRKPFADDIIEEEIKFQLIPKEIKTEEVLIPKKTNFIGVAADFACIENTGWRKTYSYAVKRRRKLYLTIGYNMINIEYDTR
jgi:type VI secretion system VasD/TssJ family lipoprotein